MLPIAEFEGWLFAEPHEGDGARRERVEALPGMLTVFLPIGLLPPVGS